jgi:hypothetical protein
MFPENHLRFSSTYSRELMKADILIWEKQSIGRRHAFLDFLESWFLSLFNSRKPALSLNRKLIQATILKFQKHRILLFQSLETEFYQFYKLDKTELNNHNNLTKDICKESY